MSEQIRISDLIYNILLSMAVEGFDSLVELTADLRWSWHHPMVPFRFQAACR